MTKNNIELFPIKLQKHVIVAKLQQTTVCRFHSWASGGAGGGSEVSPPMRERSF
jgi:hypothetical protein